MRVHLKAWIAMIACAGVVGVVSPPAFGVDGDTSASDGVAESVVELVDESIDVSRSDPSGVVCSKFEPIMVLLPTRVDRQWVDPGMYEVYEEGTSCARAIELVESWLEEGETSDGFKQYDDAKAEKGDVVLDPCVHMFVDRNDTSTRFDNETIKLVPITCDPQEGKTDEDRKLKARTSGSTVRIANGNPTDIVVTSKTPALPAKTVPAASDPKRLPVDVISNKGKTDLDVRATVQNGTEASQRDIKASSDFARHLVGAYTWRAISFDTACEYMLDVGQTRTCRETLGNTWEFTRLADDSSFGGLRYNYRVIVNFSSAPRGVSVNVINDGAQPVDAFLSSSPDARVLLMPGDRHTFIDVPARSGLKVYVERAFEQNNDRSTINVTFGDTPKVVTWSFASATGNNGQLRLERDQPGDTRRGLTAGGGTLVLTAMEDDLTARPNTSSKRYQYDAVISYP